MNDVEVIFDKNAYLEYKKLQLFVNSQKKSKTQPSYKQLLDSVNHAITNIQINHNYGDLIPKKYISISTKTKYNTDKVYRVPLVGYWRLLYTIVGDDAKIIAFILEFMDHKKYNKVFGYKDK
jgi:hypothetical protein